MLQTFHVFETCGHLGFVDRKQHWLYYYEMQGKWLEKIRGHLPKTATVENPTVRRMQSNNTLDAINSQSSGQFRK